MAASDENIIIILVSAGLYPLLNICNDLAVIDKLQEPDDFLERDTLGEAMIVDQGTH